MSVNKQLAVQMPATLFNELREVARRSDLSMAQVTRRALHRYLSGGMDTGICDACGLAVHRTLNPSPDKEST